MKVIILGVLCLILILSVIDVNPRNLPNLPLRSRTYANFRPIIRKIYKNLDSSSGTVRTEDQDSLVATAVEYFAQQANVRKEEVSISSFHTSKHNGVTHFYFQQSLNGVPVANGFGNMNVLKNGKVHSIGSSFYSGQRPAADTIEPKYKAREAVLALANALQIQTNFDFMEVPPQVVSFLQEKIVKGVSFALGDIFAELNYLQTPIGLKRVWKFNVDMPDNYFFTCVDSETNEVLSLIDYVSDASYNVVPLGVNDPAVGPLRLVQNPENREASPRGWHNSGLFENFNVTIGNNVIAQENLDGGIEYHSNYRPDGAHAFKNPMFDFPLFVNQHPTESINASITQLFYMNNVIHDIFYQYGFDEVAGNFQENNFGRGGNGSDAVIAHAQDGRGYNNADFRVMPDGINGRMRMFMWMSDDGSKLTDGVFDSGIVIHEYLHGISGRLTGGRRNTACLSSDESGGLGEGWGDIFAGILQMNQTSTRETNFEIGTYANSGQGIRRYPYSTNMDTNPVTYGYINRPAYEGVHTKGEVWTAILYEVYWNLVDKHGFQSDWYQTSRERTTLGGNIIFTQLVIDGMKLQPCDPTFIDARNAIISADEINNNGDNWHELWTGFAKRGLGQNASSPGIEDFHVPERPSGASLNFANALILFLLPCATVFNFY